MSVLSELLEELLESKNININQLSKLTGISRSTLHHYVHGKRAIQKQEHIDAITSALTLSPVQIEKVKNAFLIETIGEQLYTQRRAVYNFFRNLDNVNEKISFNIDEIPALQTESTRNGGTSYAITQRQEVISAIYNIMTESMKQHDSIMMYADPTSSNLRTILYSPVWNFNGSSFFHIFRLESVNYNRDNRNLDIIEAVVTYATVIQKYRPMYFYESYSDAESVFQLTEFIVNEHEVVQFTKACDYAIRHTEKSIVDMFRKIFGDMQKKCNSFGQTTAVVYDSIRDFEQVFGKVIDRAHIEEDTILSVSGSVAISNYWTPEIIDSYLRHDIDNYEVLSGNMYTYSCLLREVYGNTNCTIVMRKDAFKDFLKTGKVTRYPGEYLMTPVSKKDRKSIADKLIRRINNGEEKLAFIETSLYPLRDSWDLIVFKEQLYLFNYNYSNLIMIPLLERSFSYAVQDFFLDLVDNETTIRDRDAADLIQQWVDRYLV